MLKALFAFAFLPTLAFARVPTPPAQPERGPGGKECCEVRVQRSSHGSGATQYWIYQPVREAAGKVPLIIFLHGYSAMSPGGYEAWLTHLAQRGNIVIYPRYQADLVTPPEQFYQNTATSIRDALALFSKGHALTPDLTRVAVVGHSAGGVGAVTYGACAAADGLPVPRCVMAVEPGQGMENGVQFLQLGDYAKVAPETRLVVLVGEADHFVGTGSARRIWARTEHVKSRAFITVPSDHHGSPALRANHLSPLAVDITAADALDFFAYWRTFDALCEDTFAGRPLRVESAMGAWADGTPVKPLRVE